MADVWLFGDEPNPADVRLREAGAPPAVETPAAVPSYGNALATFYPDPTYLPLPKVCRCLKGRPPSRECPIHGQLVEARLYQEDELLELMLV